jgi:hypothetical protein
VGAAERRLRPRAAKAYWCVFLVGGQVSVLTIASLGWSRESDVMRRELRVEYPGAIYHVMNHGGQRNDIL